MRQLNFEFEIVALNKKDSGIRIYSSDAQKEIPDSHNVTPSYPILNQFLYVESSMFYIREVRFFEYPAMTRNLWNFSVFGTCGLDIGPGSVSYGRNPSIFAVRALYF